MTRLISGKIKKTPSANADPNRYSWLDLQNAEPDLGVPSSNGSLFVSTTTGTRSWSDTITIAGPVATINTLTVTGNSNLGSNSNIKITGGGPGQFLVSDGTNNLFWSSAAISTASGISNDQSSVVMAAPNGNIAMSVAGTSNVVVVSTTGANINGNLNLDINGYVTIGNVAANFYSTLGAMGTYTVGSDGNMWSALGSTELFIFDSSFGDVPGLGNSTQRISRGDGYSHIYGNYTVGLQPNPAQGLNLYDYSTTNFAQFAINSGVSVYADANQAGYDLSSESWSMYTNFNNVLEITSDPLSNTAIANVVGTINATNINGNTINANVFTSTELNVTGNANINGTTIDSSGNITAPFVFANVFGNISGNLAVSGSNSEVIFNKDGNSGASNAFSFNRASNVLTVTGNIDANFFNGNGSGLSSITGANVTGAVAFATTANTVAGANVSGTVANATFATSAGSTTTAGTVTTNAQPNITSIGTLSNLTVSGNTVISGNLTVDGNLIYVNVETLSVEDPIIQLQTGPNGAAPIANSGKDVGTALNYFNTQARVAFMGWDVSNAEFGMASQASITGEVVTFTSYGNLRVGNIMGNGQALTGLNGANVTGAVAFATTANSVAGANVTGTVANATFATSAGSATTAGTVTTNAQSNITSVGTLTGLGVDGNITAANITANTGIFTGNGSGLTAIPGANVTGTVANATFATSAGVVTTNAQPNITSTGTLTDLTVGNATANTIFGNGTINATGNISASTFFGNLVGNFSGNIVIPGSNTEVIFNNEGNAGASNTFTFNTATTTLKVGNALAGQGTVESGSVIFDYMAGADDTAEIEIRSDNGRGTRITASSFYQDVPDGDPDPSTSIQPGNILLYGPTGNALSLNALTGVISTVGNVTAANFVGALANGNSSVSIPAANGNIILNAGGSANAELIVTTAGANLSGILDITNGNNYAQLTSSQLYIEDETQGNYTLVGPSYGLIAEHPNIGAGYTLDPRSWEFFTNYVTVFSLIPNGISNTAVANLKGTLLVNGNITTSQLISNVATGNAPFVVTSTTQVANLNAATAGTVTTNAQPNITSVGNLTGLTVGNATSNVVISDSGTITSTGNITAPFVFANVQGNISGNFAVTGSNGEVVFNKEGNAGSSNGFSFNTTSNTLSVNGTITATAFTANTGVFAGSGANLTTLNASNISSGTLAQARLANSNVILGNTTLALGTTTTTINGLASVTSTTFVGALTGAATSATTAGTVTTNAQPNITSTGTLTDLTVGNATANTIFGNGTITSTGNITAPFVFANVQGNISGNFAVTGSNTEVIFNKEGNAGSSNAFTFDNATNALSVTGTINASGNANVLNLDTARVIATGNISGTQLISNIATGTAPLVVTSTTQVANLNAATAGTAGSATTAGTVTTNAQGNITSVGTLTGLTVGNSTANIIFGNGTINATGNITAPFVFANVQGNISGNFAVTGSNGEVIFNKEGNAGSSNGFSFNNTTNAVSVTGNITGSNLVTGGIVSATGNVTTSANLVTNLIVGRTTGITITATGTNQNITLAPTGTGTVDVSSKRITNLATPSAATDAVTKAYVDGVAEGLTVKAACRVATTGTLALATGGTITYDNGTDGVGATLTVSGGTFTTIDGVTLANDDRILVKNEATAVNNGIYVRTSTTVLTRAADFDNTPSGEVAGAFTFITNGSTNADTGFVCTTNNPVVMGTTAINFTQFSGAGTYTAGTGLTLTGSVFSITDTTVTADSYGNGDRVASFTVNAQGQITNAANTVIAANAANLTGTTLNSGVVTSSLTTVGTLGNLAVTGNITSGNANLGNAVRANYFVGDGSQLTSIPIGTSLTSGTSSVSIPAANGNVNTSVDGNANILVVTGTGANIAGTLNATGNANVLNLGTIRVIATGNISSGNADLGNLATANYFSGDGSLLTNIPIGTTLSNGTSSINIPAANGNINITRGGTANVVVITGTGVNVTGNITSGNATLGNAATANYFIGDGSQLTGVPGGQAIVNGTSNVSIPVSNGNVNISVNGASDRLVVTNSGANITGTLGVSGNANVNNLGTTTAIITTGNITTINSGLMQNGNSNVTITENVNVTINANGAARITATSTGANITGTLDVSGNANVGNIGGAAGVFTTIAGALTTNAQPNITSVGTLVNLAVSGTAATTITDTTGVPSALQALQVKNGTQVLGIGVAMGAGSYNGLVGANDIVIVGSNTDAQGNANITITPWSSATGGIRIVTVSNVTSSINLVATNTNVSAALNVVGNVTAGNVSGTSLTGTLATAAQTNITSVGTLTALTVNGLFSGLATNQGMEWGNPSAVNTPFIDFHSSGNSVRDYDVRLLSSGGNVGGLDGTGNLSVIASLVDFSGTVKTTALTTGANTTAGTVTGNWTLTAGSRWQSTYADLAERYVADEAYEPGTVVVLGGDQEVTIENIADSHKVAGVVTTNPAYIMNAELQGDNVVEVALIGRVPCKVIGPVNKGDLLTTATIPGYAYANNAASAGRIVGKSLENFNGELGIVEIMVGKT